MPSRRPALILAGLSLLAGSVLAAPAESDEYHCRRGDLVRRIEVQFANDADRLPCQVVYWRDTEGRARTPWHAENQVEFCTRKAREMVKRLQGSGWTCDAAETSFEDAAELDAATPSKGSSRAPTTTDATAPGGEPDDGTQEPGHAILQAALARDVRRLDELTGTSSWDFRPEMVTLGDLDGDGLEDAAVLLSHRDDNGGSSHHLLAYLFDGTTFRPVARISVEAYYQNFTDVVIEEIADGGIALLLRVPRAGDPACCPSGRRQATFELRDGALVLAAESESGA